MGKPEQQQCQENGNSSSREKEFGEKIGGAILSTTYENTKITSHKASVVTGTHARQKPRERCAGKWPTRHWHFTLEYSR